MSKVTITTRPAETKEVHMSAETSLALESFAQMQKAEKRLMLAELENTKWVMQIPKEEMYIYVELTNKMIQKYDRE